MAEHQHPDDEEDVEYRPEADEENTPAARSEDVESPDTDLQDIIDISEERPSSANIIKAVIFASPEYIHINTIREIAGGELTPAQIKRTVQDINEKLELDGEPFEIVEVSGCFHYRTRSRYFPWVRRVFKEAGARKLSQAALEVLAIIAYKQPITRAEVEEIRGVSVDGVLKGLLERKLIAITGKSEAVGNVYTYGTTKNFLRYFNINQIPQDLPKLSEFEDLISSTALIPQFSKDGELIELEQNEVDADDDGFDA